MSSRGIVLPVGVGGIEKHTMSIATRFATCMLCEAMCGIAVDVRAGRASAIRGDHDDAFSRGHVCPKAVALEDVRLDPDRVRAPCVRDRASGAATPAWREVGW